MSRALGNAPSVGGISPRWEEIGAKRRTGVVGFAMLKDTPSVGTADISPRRGEIGACVKGIRWASTEIIIKRKVVTKTGSNLSLLGEDVVAYRQRGVLAFSVSKNTPLCHPRGDISPTRGEIGACVKKVRRIAFEILTKRKMVAGNNSNLSSCGRDAGAYRQRGVIDFAMFRSADRGGAHPNA